MLTIARLRPFLNAAPFLAFTAALMLIDLVVCLAGLATDHTFITGVPAWMKPAKFAISTCLYALSLVIILRYTTIWKTTLRVVEGLISVAIVLEIVLIDMQAARHTTSHFNNRTDFDRHVFEAMGIAIAILWISSIVLAIAAFRTRYASPAWTVAVRYGMVLVVLGAGTGGFMTSPSRAQLEEAKRTNHMTIVGSHTIGGVDGGKGLPLVGWSTEHGDVRIAHFAGLHGLQILALFVFVLDRLRVAPRKARKLAAAAVASYGSFFFIALTQALLARPITSREVVFTAVWIVWAILSAAAFFYAARQSDDSTDFLRPGETEALA